MKQNTLRMMLISFFVIMSFSIVLDVSADGNIPLTGTLPSDIYNNPGGGVTITNASVEPSNMVLVIANGGDIVLNGEVNIQQGSTFNAIFGNYSGLTKNTDSDHNGMPDWWELVNFSQTGQNPNADPTNSGISNYWKSKLQLDPSNPNSRPAPGTYYEYDSLGRIKGMLRN